eukprot:TRINITY_DN27133_c0_g2_i1.p1 TRINITY_DN27133_c0_g2~~TRINITY_DN27133_c0_g2_i1.p1  ORF type:complete len:397 (-),score=58.92 TRINITY_DN27133_c0_g2_i1:43-1233(-)
MLSALFPSFWRSQPAESPEGEATGSTTTGATAPRGAPAPLSSGVFLSAPSGGSTRLIVPTSPDASSSVGFSPVSFSAPSPGGGAGHLVASWVEPAGFYGSLPTSPASPHAHVARLPIQSVPRAIGHGDRYMHVPSPLRSNSVQFSPSAASPSSSSNGVLAASLQIPSISSLQQQHYLQAPAPARSDSVTFSPQAASYAAPPSSVHLASTLTMPGSFSVKRLEPPLPARSDSVKFSPQAASYAECTSGVHLTPALTVPVSFAANRLEAPLPPKSNSVKFAPCTSMPTSPLSSCTLATSLQIPQTQLGANLLYPPVPSRSDSVRFSPVAAATPAANGSVVLSLRAPAGVVYGSKLLSPPLPLRSDSVKFSPGPAQPAFSSSLAATLEVPGYPPRVADR